jgi:hypothetical protein
MMSESTHAWIPIGLVQHHAQVHTDVLYMWTIEESSRIRYEARLGRDDPGRLRVTLSEIIARFDILRKEQEQDEDEVTMKHVVELFIQDYFDLEPHECLIELCVSCCAQGPFTS